MRTAIFRVRALHPSLNQWTRLPPLAVHRRKRAHAEEVYAAIVEARQGRQWDGHPFVVATVTYTFHFPTAGRHDPDNAVPKFAQDALVAAGVLVDDDFAHCTLVLRRGANANPGWTEIRVEGA